ncbi:NAD-dependent epimerase/dehydratase family protein, partial [Streptomyces sp. NPDC059072]
MGPMRIAVTGSTGLIGSALVRSLREDGHEVVRFVRREPAAGDEARWDPARGHVDPEA